ncbi:hypothetical protein [Trichloromonas sp.]|uniref:hypothetical protein n=1 Tax=Trichloromonas sp. TaxID=3069249 RepID=UPI002A4A4BAC|nr:hypothetical protein [Trichloromonas sp.]
MRKTIIATVSIMVFGMALVFFIHSAHNRFALVINEDGKTYQIDKRSGKTWLIEGDKKTPLDAPDQPRPKLEEFEMAAEDLKNLQVEGRIRKGTFFGKLYNGTGQPITRVTFKVNAREADGRLRWSRDFTEGMFVKPQTTGRFAITVTDGDDVGEVSWIIVKAFTRPLTNDSPAGR